MSNALTALLSPFATGQLSLPPAARGFLLRAEPGIGLDDGWRSILVCEQAFKPSFDALQLHGFQVVRALSDDGFDVGLCLLSKHKAENLANLGRAWQMLRPGGLLVCSGATDIGAASIARTLAATGVEIGSLSKAHCKVFWTHRTAETPAALTAWTEAGRLQWLAEPGIFSQPGLYNWDSVDPGSALLAEHWPADLGGRVADLGAGWGYLSARLLETGHPVTALDLYEADGRALEAAQANLARLATTAAVDFHWYDVTAGLPAARYDWVVMNPPFHHGKATDIDLGRTFITAAAGALAPGGRMIMVANRQLPYEPLIQASFAGWRTLIETPRYKVIEAWRRPA
ncbi:MAG TPA: methyltransferase [Patescibacteria group bacterium]|nr:methyltransferase [Patescibacteria group bacterium]